MFSYSHSLSPSKTFHYLPPSLRMRWDPLNTPHKMLHKQTPICPSHSTGLSNLGPRHRTLFHSQLYLYLIYFKSCLCSNSINLLSSYGKYFLDFGFLDWNSHVCYTLTERQSQTMPWVTPVTWKHIVSFQGEGEREGPGLGVKDQCWRTNLKASSLQTYILKITTF